MTDTLPPPPVDVKLHLHDGRVIPADSHYVGRDEADFAVWEVDTRGYRQQDIAQVTVAEIPPRTTLVMSWHR